MRVVVAGLGVQGHKRIRVAGDDVVATVDPIAHDANYKSIKDVPLDTYDTVLVCTPDSAKIAILEYLLSNGKHALVEKPLLATATDSLQALHQLAQVSGCTVYTAYNHRFEPNLVKLKALLDGGELGEVYTARLFYGNGTAADTRSSPWRDSGLGVLSDLGSHLLDLVAHLFGDGDREFQGWSLGRYENQSPDHVVFGSTGRPFFELEATLLSWRNTFTIDVLAAKGSAHVSGLCKWGPSTLTIRKRVYPSGVPDETVVIAEGPDPTWSAEYAHFRRLAGTGFTSIAGDMRVSAILHEVGRQSAVLSSR